MIPNSASVNESMRSQTDVVISGIKEMLTMGEISPGSRLPNEKDLAAHLGVSRGSLREGIRALAALGIVETRQGDGTYITALDPQTLLGPLGFLADLQQNAEAAELLAVRRYLEAESAALASTRLTDHQLVELEELLAKVDVMLQDEESLNLDAVIQADRAFHSMIARASGNPPLAALIEALGGRTLRARVWRAISQRGSVAEAQAEHRAILAELKSRAPDRARIRMEAHLLGVEEFSASHGAEDVESFIDSPSTHQPGK